MINTAVSRLQAPTQPGMLSYLVTSSISQTAVMAIQLKRDGDVHLLAQLTFEDFHEFCCYLGRDRTHAGKHLTA